MRLQLHHSVLFLLGVSVGYAWTRYQRKAQGQTACTSCGEKATLKVVGHSPVDLDNFFDGFNSTDPHKSRARRRSGNPKGPQEYVTFFEEIVDEKPTYNPLEDGSITPEMRSVMENMNRQGEIMLNQFLREKGKQLANKGKKVGSRAELIQAIKSDVQKTQVTISNTSEKSRKVALWEANKNAAVSPPELDDVEDHILVDQVEASTNIGQAIHPQGMAFNRATGFIYVANQLSNNVSVVGNTGFIQSLISVEPDSFPGYNSPVAIAVNNVVSRSGYGEMYVIGSVANTLTILDRNHETVAVLPTGNRPVSVYYNPVNGLVYVGNLVGASVTVIDPELQVVTRTLFGHPTPWAISGNPVTGEVYILNQDGGAMTVLDKYHQVVQAWLPVGYNPVNLAYQPTCEEIYVVLQESQTVQRFNAETLLPVGDPIPVGQKPLALAYNFENDYMYVGNTGEGTMTVISCEGNVSATIDVGVGGQGIAINPNTNLIFLSSTATNSLQVIGYREESSQMEIDPQLKEKRQEFQHEPVILKNAKFFFSGDASSSTLQVRQTTAGNKVEEKTLAFGNYISPDDKQNVAEVKDLEGMVVDGQNGWGFQVPPGESVTILMDYQQLDRYHLMPEKAPVVPF